MTVSPRLTYATLADIAILNFNRCDLRNALTDTGPVSHIPDTLLHCPGSGLDTQVSLIAGAGSSIRTVGGRVKAPGQTQGPLLRILRQNICMLLLAFIPALPAYAQQKKPPAKPQDGVFAPRDEAASDQSWTRFRDRLLQAVQERDKKFVLGIVARNVRNGLEQPAGIEEFVRQWDIDAEDSPLWRELPRALHLGAAWYSHEKMPRSLCAPYVLPRWPKDADPHGYGAITARETALRAGPSGSVEILTNLGHSIVRVIDWEVADSDADTRQKWVKIRSGKREGFIPEEHIRSPLEHLACFRKGETGWRLTSFLAAGE